MPGRTPTEAVNAFLGPLKSAIACVTRAQLTISANGRHNTDKVQALTINNGRHMAQMRSTEHGHMLLDVKMWYKIVPMEEEKRAEDWMRWRVTTHGYLYSVQLRSGEAVVDYHWHPNSKMNTPHLHVGSAQLAKDGVVSRKTHLPTSRVSLEKVLLTCITELGVEHLKDDWEECLTLGDGKFRLHRSWHTDPSDKGA